MTHRLPETRHMTPDTGTPDTGTPDIETRFFQLSPHDQAIFIAALHAFNKILYDLLVAFDPDRPFGIPAIDWELAGIEYGTDKRRSTYVFKRLIPSS